MPSSDYACTRCGWSGDECDRDDHYPVCPDCGAIVNVNKTAGVA